MRRSSVLCLSIASVVALAAMPARADGVSATLGAGHDLVFTIDSEAANIHFNYSEHECDGGAPCVQVDASQGMVGVPVTGAGGCVAKPGNEMTPGHIECPAAGLASVTFAFKNGGTWSGYQGGGGQHAGGPCAPFAVTVKTGPGGGAMSVNAWNGCRETVNCDSPASVFTGVEVDANDVIAGRCMSVVNH